jgi:histone deacetylase complex regulatory component SIN3
MLDNDGDLIFIDNPTIQDFLDADEHNKKYYVIRPVAFLNKWRRMNVNRERVYYEFIEAINASDDKTKPLDDITIAVFNRFFPH